MTAFARTLYDYNSRFVLNDKTTNTNRYALVDELAQAETTTTTIETDRPVAEGGIDFGSKISSGLIEVPLVLYASSLGHMNDLVDVLKQAFNPQLVEDDATWGKGVLNFPAGDGFMPLKWTEALGTGTRAVQIFVKPLEVPAVALDTTGGRIREGKLKLRIEDPRKYSQTLGELVGAGTAANTGNYRTPVKITIGATGTTSTSLTITNSTTGESIVVSTALSIGQTLVIDTRHQSVKLNNVEKRSMISSTSKWIHLKAGNNTIAIANGGNCVITTNWLSCWAV